MNSLARVTDFVRDEEISISCNASFFLIDSRSSLEFIDFQYVGGTVVEVRILRIYLTSHRNDTSNTSSYVLSKAPEDGVFPPYTCNIVCDFYTNISDLSGDSSMELSFSTDPLDVLCKYTVTTTSFLVIHSIPIRDRFMYSFILNIYIAPLQDNYSEALPTPARLKRAVLS